MPPTPVARLRNLGPVSARWLDDVGIRTESQLRAVGTVAAFRMVAMAGHRPSLNLAYAIEAAIRGIDWRDLPAAARSGIREALDQPWHPSALPEVPA